MNYTHTQIHVSPNAAKEMARLRKNVLPTMPLLLFNTISTDISIIHLNIGGIHRKIPDIQHDDILKLSDIISLNETHLAEHDLLNAQMMNQTDISVFRYDHNNFGGVAQGGHGTGKTGNLTVNFSRQEKHREFSKFNFLHRENCGNTGKILKI